MNADYRQQREGSYDADPSEDFDFATLDSLDDMVDELRSKRQSVEPLFRELLKREDSSGRCAAITAFVAYILDTDKPRQTAAVIAWCSGMSVLEGKSAVEMAAQFGVSKQAWCALAKDLCERLGISPPRSIRSEMGCEEMRRSHFKRTK